MPSKPERNSRQHDYSALSPCAVQWLASGDRGISSETIFTVLTGHQLVEEDNMSHPLDGMDFRRCCLLLDCCPELSGRFVGMRSLSPEWDALVRAWYSIFAVMDHENPQWRVHAENLSRTHRRLAEVLTGIDKFAPFHDMSFRT